MGTVLVADDSKTIRTICQWVFKGSPHQVLLATAGDEAMHAAQTNRPDVIVLDYTLPDTDAFELCKTIKSDPGLANIAVLMLGGNFADFDEDKAASFGADDTLFKPFRADDLAGKIDDLTQRAAAGNIVRFDGSAPPMGVAPQVEAAPPAPPADATPQNPVAAAPAHEPAAAPAQKSRFSFPARGGAAGGGQPRFRFPAKGAEAPAAAAPAPAPTPQPAPAAPAPAPTPAPAPVAAAPVAAQAPVAVDEDMVRAEVQRLVREMLPGMVKGILKDLIQREVTPQLQRWLESRMR